VLIIAAVLTLVVLASVAWLTVRGRAARTEVARMQADASTLGRQLSDYDLTAAAATMGSLRRHADRAHALTGDPVWAVATLTPFWGNDIHAARATSAVVSDIADAATPLEGALPRLRLAGTAGMRLDPAAVAQISAAMPALSAAVSSGSATMAGVGTDGIRPDLASGVRTLRHTLSLAQAPVSDAAPESLRDLWGADLSEWAGLNLSPHFPWTGQLVTAGWRRGHPSAPLNYVVGVDQGMVAGMLAGTGPVTVRGVRLDSRNVQGFLSRGIYARFSNPLDVDAVTAELVQQVFARLTAGKIDLPAMVTAMRAPLREGRLQVWSADPDEQQQLETLSIGGALPEDPGAFAMAVINNGGGNKLDAYLKVRTTYDPGPCAQQVRVGRISVQLENDAPRSGLPAYVTPRSDLIELRRLGKPAPRAVVGSNKILLDVYGPVGAQAALTTLDGKPLSPTTGLDRAHTVWRVEVPIDPGQRRTIEIVLTQPVPAVSAQTRADVRTQPMVLPATITAARLQPCSVGAG
jgi:hypothetical protein